jgi:hypothetical protein
MSLSERERETEGDEIEKIGADRTTVVLEPRSSELSVLRASVSQWLLATGQQGVLADDVRQVASEMAAIAVDRGDGERAIVVELRRTHSILVVEVTFHLGPDASLTDLDVPGERIGVDLGLVEHLADRVAIDPGGRRAATLRSTFHHGEPTR